MSDIEHGHIESRNITTEIKTSFLSYAMSVIVSRALPDVRDGLKPVHRRILYGMQELGNTSDKPYKKSARIVGDVMGKYHPHGDSSIYDAMVNLAQPWKMRYTLVEGQGNFGSVDGDSAAARCARPADLRYANDERRPAENGRPAVETYSGQDDHQPLHGHAHGYVCHSCRAVVDSHHGDDGIVCLGRTADAGTGHQHHHGSEHRNDADSVDHVAGL